MKFNITIKAIMLGIAFMIYPNYAGAETVDLLILYDKAASTVNQGKDMPAKVASLVEHANKTYKNSDVNIKLRVVHLQKIAVSRGENVSSEALNNLARQQNVNALREKYGADLVVLMTLRRNIAGGYVCGIGYVPRGNGKLTSRAKSAGFSVSAVNCDNATFVHELGHNMALGHSFAQNSTGGILKWGRGHGKQNNFVTTMAYPQAYGRAIRVQQFSSPTQVKCNGLPCGVAHNKNDAADAVDSLNKVAKQVSAFYPTKVPSTSAPTTPTPTPTAPKPAPTPIDSNNIVPNGNFDSLGSWENYRGQSSLKLTNHKFSSKYGLKVYKRQSAYSGPVQSIQIKAGKAYKFSAYAALATPFSARSLLAAQLVINTSRGTYSTYLDIASIVRGQWTKLESSFELSKYYGKVHNAELRFFGPWKGRDFYLDEVAIKAK